MEHSTLRIRAELGSAIPEGMFGFVQANWFDPKNPIGEGLNTDGVIETGIIATELARACIVIRNRTERRKSVS